MDAYEAILTRRSIRKYRSDPIPEAIVTDLLRAAMSAPSAGNDRPWHFIIMNERKLMDSVPEFHPYAAFIKEAPLAIVVCGDTSVGKIDGFWVQDCSAAAQNLLLAIHARGLGGVWLGVYPLPERIEGARRLLNLPWHIMPLCIITLGYPAETKPAAGRYDATKVHHNGWG